MSKNEEDKKPKNVFLFFSCIIALLSIPIMIMADIIIPDVGFEVVFICFACVIASFILAWILAICHENNNPSMARIITLVYLGVTFFTLNHSTNESNEAYLSIYMMILVVIYMCELISLFYEAKSEKNKKDTK